MAVLIAAVVVVGIVATVDLLLTYGVIRRLREHSEQLAKLGVTAKAAKGELVGATVAEFDAIDHTGKVVTLDSFTGHTLVGFMSPGCTSCTTLLPKFVDVASTWGANGGSVMAFVLPGPGAAPYAHELEPVAGVVTGPQAQLVANAFGVHGFPAVCVVGRGGVIEYSGADVTDLRSPVRA